MLFHRADSLSLFILMATFVPRLASFSEAKDDGSGSDN